MKKILICALVLALAFLVSCDFSNTLEEFSNNMMKTVKDAAGSYLKETEVPGEESESSDNVEESSSDDVKSEDKAPSAE